MSESRDDSGFSTRVAGILLQFEKAFRDGRNPQPEKYLTGEGEGRWQLLVELLHSNLELRLRAGEKLHVRDYLDKYPDLANHPGDIFALLAVELRFLKDQGENPQLEEYEQNYGKLVSSSLKPLFEQAEHQPIDCNVGKQIANRYKLLSLLGQGGMGTVYLAEQSEPVKRQVALKLIKPGVDSRNYIVRFEAERQALALMDHTNIARVYDGGTTDTRQPFYVMELVQGIPLTQYCDQHKLSLIARLELFVQICQAVQHAHQKGIIHRDLKPANVLVTVIDGRSVPKIIDFGLAKATEQPLTDETIEEFGAVGTPAYMSPEQADLEKMDVDTRTDVYALGVILYELLTGSTPIDAKQFRRGALMEMLRMICEEEPPRPSTRLSSAEELPSIAANRAVEPRQLLAWIRGDIDWIVMKALEKDRNRRYETASGFAADVQRYLCGEPVLAHPPTRWYRAKKFVRRNKVQVVAAGLVLASLLIGLAASLWQMIRAENAEFLAKQESEEKQKQLKVATEEKLIANAVKEFLQKKLLRQYDLSSQADSLLAIGRTARDAEYDPRISTLLDRAAIELSTDKIDTNFPNQLRLQAELLQTIGITYLGSGKVQKSIGHLERARDLYAMVYGKDHQVPLTSMHNIAIAYKASGHANKAVEMLIDLYNKHKLYFGEANINTLAIQISLSGAYLAIGNSNKAIEILNNTLMILKQVHVNELHTMNDVNHLLASAYAESGNISKAIEIGLSVREFRIKNLGYDHPETISSIHNLAGFYRSIGKQKDALAMLEDLHKVLMQKAGPKNPDVYAVKNELALSYLANKNWNAAVEILECIRNEMADELGVEHPNTLSMLANLAWAYRETNKLSESEPILEKVLGIQAKKLGDDHPNTLATRNNLAGIQFTLGKIEKAVLLYEESYHLTRKKQGDSHPNTIVSMGNLGIAYCRSKQGKKAIPLLRKYVDDKRERSPIDKVSYASGLHQISSHLIFCKQYMYAEELLRECLLICNDVQPDKWVSFHAKSLLGEALLGQKKYVEAEAMLLQGYEGLKAREKTIPKHAIASLPEALDHLIQLYTETNKPDEVKKWQAERAKYSAIQK